MKVLLVEDDLKIAEDLIEGLEKNNFSCIHVSSAEEGLELALKNVYSLIITDLMLPKLNGLEMISNLRGHKVNTPVLILTAKRSLDERLIGLQSGGDDYLVKPYAFLELLARANNLIRRTSPEQAALNSSLLSYEDLTLNIFSREVTRAHQKIDLQTKEYQLLEYFMRNAEVPLSKNQILEKIWGYNFDPQTNVVDVLVYRLRKKIDKDFGQTLIQTIKGIGYVFKLG